MPPPTTATSTIRRASGPTRGGTQSAGGWFSRSKSRARAASSFNKPSIPFIDTLWTIGQSHRRPRSQPTPQSAYRSAHGRLTASPSSLKHECAVPGNPSISARLTAAWAPNTAIQTEKNPRPLAASRTNPTASSECPRLSYLERHLVAAAQASSRSAQRLSRSVGAGHPPAACRSSPTRSTRPFARRRNPSSSSPEVRTKPPSEYSIASKVLFRSGHRTSSSETSSSPLTELQLTQPRRKLLHLSARFR